MKRITMLAFLSICAIGFGQNKSLDQREEAKSPTTMDARTVTLPAAYSNNAGTTVSENAGVATQGQRVADVSVPFTGTYYNNLAPNSIIYYNGPYWNVAGDPKLSMLESLALGMNTIGSQAKLVDGTSIADDVVFTNDVEITSIDLFAYQTGATIPLVTAVYVRIWAGDPSSGGTIVWGDLTTNIIGDVSSAGANRVTETDQGDTSRQIQKVTALTAGLSLTAGTYWVEYTFEGTSSSGPWTPPIVILGEDTTGNGMQNQAGTWVPTLDSGTSTPQGYPFIMYGNITGGGTFPAPYCEVGYFVVEPITLVEVANISNRSSEVVGGSPAHEDFTAITGNMREEESYTITLEGNTNGDNITSFTVFLDWDQDGTFNNEDERYQIGTIQNSTGIDGVQATGTITVPEGVAGGLTRMRVMKNLGTDYAMDACTGFFGQAEDYTVDVRAAAFPDPYCGPLTFTIAVEPITLVEVAGISNRTDATIGGSPAHEDFTAIEGDMEEGMTYEIALEGNTGGYANSFTVFIDWNQDGILDNEEERYEIGVIDNSTGTDGQQAIGNIVVPAGVTEGPTRMRVIKRFTSSGDGYATDSCTPGSNYGQAEDYTINVSLSENDFPAPYCGPIEYEYAVEPITLVEVAGICNRTDATVNGSPAHEDFTDIVGEMEEGQTYPIALEGHTGGFITSFTVFIDWNQDGILDNEGERFEIGSISYSNGEDGQQATGNILAPIGATEGPTRMRVIKRFTSTGEDFAIDSCTPGSNYGQAEDYTINVTATVGIADNALAGFSYYPNPTSGELSLKSVNNIDSVAIYNMLGQKVLDAEVGATTSNISLSGLTTGTYIMKVTVEGQTGTYKVLKH